MIKRAFKDENGSSDLLGDLGSTIARFAMIGGAIVFIGSLAFLFILINRAGTDPQVAATLIGNMDKAKQLGILGAVLMVVGAAFTFWEEEIMVATNIILGIGLYLAPTWVPMVINGPGANSEAFNAGVSGVSSIGISTLIMGLLVLVGDITIRVKNRATQGTKADQLKYGKGIKQETDKQNVFMGKCWQLPYCRKFVRERCPIFHAKRTCWKELVGCMCEESVIRNAMENKVVSKEALLSGAAIPQNNKLSTSAKKERCYNCVIYNEHQKHKYRLSLPLLMLSSVGLYIIIREPAANAINRMIGSASTTMNSATGGAIKDVNTGEWFTQFLVLAIVVVFATYALKVLEFAIFRLKV